MATIVEAFNLAWQNHQAGYFAQAEQLYRQILQADPRHADAWLFLGAVCQAQGRLAEAGPNFAWRLPSIDGISASREENPAGLRLVFSGEEPEACAPLVRILPVRENTAYEFTVLYRTAGIQAGAGLAWHVRGLDEADLMGAPESLASEDGAQARLRFITPSGCRLVRIALEYRRALGSTRIEGSIILRGAGLQATAQPPEKEPGRVMK